MTNRATTARRSSFAVALCLILGTGCGSTAQQVSSGRPVVPWSGAGDQAGRAQPGLEGVASAAVEAVPGAAMPGASNEPVGGTLETQGQMAGAPDSSGGAGRGAAGSVAAAGGPVTGPVQIGILDVSSVGAALDAIGASAENTTDTQALVRAFVRYYNKRGGAAGRTLQVVEYTINPSSNNYEADLAAACARFTQDANVRVVLSHPGAMFSESYQNCLAKRGVVNLEMQIGAPDESALQRYPRLYSLAAPTADRRMTAVLRGLHGGGALTPGNKIGILVEDCPHEQRALKRAVEPLARALGLNIVQSRTIMCLRGFSDIGQFQAQVQAAVLPFRSEGVDRVVFVSSWEALMLLAFENQAQSQGYAPHYAVSSNVGATANAATYPSGALPRIRGVGWLPWTDVANPPENNASKACFQMAASEGIRAASQTDKGLILLVCEMFRVFVDALKTATGSDAAERFVPAIAASSRTFESALHLGDRTRLGRYRDAPVQFARFDYVKSCSCFRYTGPPRPLA